MSGKDSLGTTCLTHVLVSLKLLTYILAHRVGIAQACHVDEFVSGHEVCNLLALANSTVHGVYFEGLIANLPCLASHVEVSSLSSAIC
jgi:hypothetical protein